MVSIMLRNDDVSRRPRLRTTFMVSEAGGGLSSTSLFLNKHVSSLPQTDETSDRGLPAWLLLLV